MNATNNPVIEIVHVETDSIVVCDTFAYCLDCDDGLRDEETEIRAALSRGDFYMIGGGAAAGFVIRLAPPGTIVN